MSCFKIMLSALMTRFSISVPCVCFCICPFCACLVNIIKHYKCPLQYMLDESTPSNSARCNPPAHITVGNAQTFQQLAQANVLLLYSPCCIQTFCFLWPALMLFLLTWILSFNSNYCRFLFPFCLTSDQRSRNSALNKRQLATYGNE